MITDKSRPPVNDGTLRNPLAGLLRCSRCGRNIQLQGGASVKGGARMLCVEAGCTPSAKYEYVEASVIEHLRDELKRLTVSVPDKPSQSESKTERLLVSTRRELQSAQTQKIKLYELLEQGVYDKEVFRERMAVTKQKIESLEKKLIELGQEIDREKDFNPQRTAKAISDVLDAFALASIEGKNTLLKSVIDHIIYEKAPKSKPGDFKLYIKLKTL